MKKSLSSDALQLWRYAIFGLGDSGEAYHFCKLLLWQLFCESMGHGVHSHCAAQNSGKVILKVSCKAGFAHLQGQCPATSMAVSLYLG